MKKASDSYKNAIQATLALAKGDTFSTPAAPEKKVEVPKAPVEDNKSKAEALALKLANENPENALKVLEQYEKDDKSSGVAPLGQLN